MARSFDSRDMRNALSSFATGVTIVTASDADGQPVGMTASSFNSVSMDPPLVLWSVDKTSLSADAFKDAKYYAVHILASDQIALSNQFAKRGTDKFRGVSYQLDANQVPIVDKVAARFDCSAWSTYEGGDHWIIVGEVQALQHSNCEALVFSDGSYATATPIRPPDSSAKVKPPADAPTQIDDLLIYNLARAHRQTTAQFHEIVRESGLSVSQWRILSSLFGKARYGLPELSARTFLESKALNDQLALLAQEGLCMLDRGGYQVIVQGTQKGHERVQNLFELAQQLEHTALGDKGSEGLGTLVTLLREVIANSTH